MSLFDTQKRRKNAITNNINKDYYKAVKTDDAFYHNYIEYESKGDENKSLSIKEYLEKIRLCLKHITLNLRTFGVWKTHLTIEINFGIALWMS